MYGKFDVKNMGEIFFMIKVMGFVSFTFFFFFEAIVSFTLSASHRPNFVEENKIK